ncbi:MAG: hypothetical protein ABIH49_03485 [archaeon]
MIDLSVLQWFAFILAAFALIKISVILVNGKAWLKFAKWIWQKPAVTGIIFFLLALVVFYYLIQQMTIVQIFAVMLFVTLLFGSAMSPYVKHFLKLGDSLVSKKAIRNYWPEVIIWVILSLWALKEIFW